MRELGSVLPTRQGVALQVLFINELLHAPDITVEEALGHTRLTRNNNKGRHGDLPLRSYRPNQIPVVGAIPRGCPLDSVNARQSAAGYSTKS